MAFSIAMENVTITTNDIQVLDMPEAIAAKSLCRVIYEEPEKGSWASVSIWHGEMDKPDTIINAAMVGDWHQLISKARRENTTIIRVLAW